MLYIFVFIIHLPRLHSSFFFFNDTATTEIYTLSLHDALPISDLLDLTVSSGNDLGLRHLEFHFRSEEHTSELQSPDHLVCRLLLEKKKKCSSNLLVLTTAIYRRYCSHLIRTLSIF